MTPHERVKKSAVGWMPDGLGVGEIVSMRLMPKFLPDSTEIHIEVTKTVVVAIDPREVEMNDDRGLVPLINSRLTMAVAEIHRSE